MMTEYVVKIENLKKKYKRFCLDIQSLEIPKGFATALIGENGAGKSTLLNILSGICLDYKGKIIYADDMKKLRSGKGTVGLAKNTAEKEEQAVRENTGYTGAQNYFMPHWTIRQIGKISELLFESFSEKHFETLCEEMNLGVQKGIFTNLKPIANLSDGMKMKAMLAAVFARDTRLLLLDEPASPLDPLMRDKLCDMIHTYLDEGRGERSVLFSTHNIADMEYVTDYAIIMDGGIVIEQGFVEELKEKYVLVKGERIEQKKAENVLYSISPGAYGYEGICRSEEIEKLAGMDVALETPTLSQISIAVMKHYANRKNGVRE